MMNFYMLREQGELGYDLIRVSDGTEIGYDYGEPEDRTFTRDFASVVDELNRVANENVRLRSAISKLRTQLTKMLEICGSADVTYHCKE